MERALYQSLFQLYRELKISRSQLFAALTMPAYIHAGKAGSRKPVLLVALKIMLHAKSLSDDISHLRVLAFRKGYAGHCLVEGRGGKLGLLSA